MLASDHENIIYIYSITILDLYLLKEKRHIGLFPSMAKFTIFLLLEKDLVLNAI